MDSKVSLKASKILRASLFDQDLTKASIRRDHDTKLFLLLMSQLTPREVLLCKTNKQFMLEGKVVYLTRQTIPKISTAYIR